MRRRKAREFAKNKNKNTNKKKKNKTEDFHAFFQAIIPIVQEIWTDRCIDRNTPVVGGRIVAEYDSLTRVSRKLSTRKHVRKTRMTNNPLTAFML
jgi:hypothetical protein